MSEVIELERGRDGGTGGREKWAKLGAGSGGRRLTEETSRPPGEAEHRTCKRDADAEAKVQVRQVPSRGKMRAETTA